MKILFHGHSFVELSYSQWSILIDPYINGNPSCDVTFDDMIAKNIVAIVVTHGHDDHIGETVELAQVSNAVVITTYELGKYLMNEKWLENVSTHGIWWWVDYGDYHIKFFQAWHGWWITSYTHGYTTVAAGVILSIWWKTIYHAWDTGLFLDMKMLKKLYDIDLAFLPIGDRYTMWIKDASIATGWIKPKRVVPIHYNTWEKISADTDKFEKLVGKESSNTKVIVMEWWDEIKL